MYRRSAPSLIILIILIGVAAHSAACSTVGTGRTPTGQYIGGLQKVAFLSAPIREATASLWAGLPGRGVILYGSPHPIYS